MFRRSRRGRKLRYRKPRFKNRSKPKGWLAPSLIHRVTTTLTWVNKLIRLAGVDSIAVELVKFDMQKMVNPEISGIEYQQGELAGYEVREYLLEKWNRTCAYCKKRNVPLQIEHINPKSRGGSNRISNLTLACSKCNLKKGTQTAKEFGFPNIQAKARLPLKDAAAVNSTRNRLWSELCNLNLPIEAGTGGQTKYNRTKFKLPKEHWIDAACVGNMDYLEIKTGQSLLIKCTGHGSRIMCRTDKYGFPRCRPKCPSRVFGFKTGDIVKANLLKGKNKGSNTGRVLVRKTGSFKVDKADGINYKYCRHLHKADGYSYDIKKEVHLNFRSKTSFPWINTGVSASSKRLTLV